MNPYQALLAQHLFGAEAPKPEVDVAQNIGHEHLKKKPYNPYNLVQAGQNPETMVASPEQDKKKSFSQEMLHEEK